VRLHRPFLLAVLAQLAALGAVRADLITLQFTGRVTTVSGDPLGLSPALNTSVTGSFVYDTSTSDTDPGDPVRGVYPHTNGGFSLTIGPDTLTGSSTPLVRVNNDLGGVSDEFRFNDGPGMSLGGVLNANARLDFVIVDGSPPDALSSDALPTVFPFTPANPHTLAISDASQFGEVILIQFDTLAQVQGPTAVPEPSCVALGILSSLGALWYARRRRARIA
jgi:hypothetical protein